MTPTAHLKVGEVNVMFAEVYEDGRHLGRQTVDVLEAGTRCYSSYIYNICIRACMRMNRHTHIHAYVHIHKIMYACTYYAYEHIYIRTFLRTYLHKYVRNNIMYVRAFVLRVFVLTHFFMCVHTFVHDHTQSNVSKHARMHK